MESANKILDKAMKLPEAERALISEKLFQSLHPLVDEEVEASWKAEIERRLEEFESGKVKLVDWNDVKKKSM